MQTSEPVRRNSEIEEVTNLYFIHPIASRLTLRFAALGVSANAVSVLGMVFGILAGVAYFHYRNPLFAVAGFVLMIAWHVMDGADGQLARLTNSQSQTGKVLDGICDYVTFIAVYTGLALALSGEYGGWVWWLVALAGLCHAVQSAAYEVQRQEYNFWGWSRKSVDMMLVNAQPRGTLAASPVEMLLRFYTRVQFLAAGVSVEFHKKLDVILGAQPERSDVIRQQYRATFAPVVRRWGVMSANYRTLGIFLCALAGVPLYYFAFEIVGFSVILVMLLARQQARYGAFLKAVAPAHP
jgi:phosphatidylserine synthase